MGNSVAYLEGIRLFVRVFDLGNITQAGRNLRMTPATASSRLKELEAKLGVRLFNRTTRKLAPTEAGRVFYEYAKQLIDTLDDAEAAVAGVHDAPRGVIHATAPLGVGRRVIGPLVPAFVEQFPEVEVRLRLSDRRVDLFDDVQDVAFFLGALQDSTLKYRSIADCERVLCAAPDYLERHGIPACPDDLIAKHHNCLLLRYPRSPEYFWVLQTENGPLKLEVAGKYDADDGDVLTDWALAGKGIANKVKFDVRPYLDRGELVEVLSKTPPLPANFGCLFPHRKLLDPKIRHFVDFMVKGAKKALD